MSVMPPPPAPKPGQSASLAYRLRNLFLDRWNLWPRLTFYRTWKNAQGQPFLDGTNNADERAIWAAQALPLQRGTRRSFKVCAAFAGRLSSFTERRSS